MITKIWITAQVEHIPGYAAKILKPAGCGPDVVDILDLKIIDKRTIKLTIKLEVADERVAKVQALLQQHGAAKVESFTYQDYSDAELRAARLLWLCPVLTCWVAPGVFGGTEYDLTEACRNCRAGAKQSSILYLSEPDQKTLKKTAATGSSENEIVVDDGLRQELIAAGVTADLVGMQDFNLTWEWFGEFRAEDRETGQVALRPCPSVLVTPKVFDIFRKAGVKSFDWKPVNVAP